MHREDLGVSHKPRIIVVLEPHPESARLLRIAKRKAELEILDWEVLLIETPQQALLSAQDRQTLASLETLAEQMGGIVTRISAPSMLNAVQKVVEERQRQGITIYSVKVGQLQDKYGWIRLRAPLYYKLQRHLPPGIRVSVIPLGPASRRSYPFLRLLHVRGREILISLVAVLVATACIEALNYFWPAVIGAHNHNKTIIYMTACAYAGGRYGVVAGLVASVSSFLALSLLYIPPYNSLFVQAEADAINLALFVLATFMISILGSRDYGNRMALLKRAERLHSLLQVHRMVLNKQTPAEAVATLEEELKTLLGREAVFFLPSVVDEKKLETILYRDLRMSIAEERALKLCWEESKTTGVGSPFQPEGCRWRFEPMLTAHDEIGVMAVRMNAQYSLDEDTERLFSSIADQTALILERLQLGQLAERNKIQVEREKLRAMLLSSVSHDLKTPLASVIGSLSVLRSMGKSLSEEHKVTLLSTAIDEAQRLDSFITNILDMTRIESGQVELKSEWIKPAELVGEIARRLRERLRRHELRIMTDKTPLEVRMDVLMTGQVIQNLLDNAAKYTQAGTVIEVSWQRDRKGNFALQVRDHGPGIPEDHLEKIFDKYTRLKRQDSQVAGTGLGLSIARAILEAQGGMVTAENHPEGGAVFTLTLPSSRNAEDSKAA